MQGQSSTYLTPFNESMKPQDGRIGSFIIKVRVLDSISGISQAQSSGVSPPFPDGLRHRQEITGTLRHLLPIQHQVTVRSHTEWPVLFREDSSVVVNAEGEVVGYEVLPRGTDVEWVEVREGTSESFKFVLRDVGGVGEGARSENVVPDLIGHLLNCDAQQPRSLALNVG